MIACSVALWPLRKHSFFDKDTYPRVSQAVAKKTTMELKSGKNRMLEAEVWLAQ